MRFRLFFTLLLIFLCSCTTVQDNSAKRENAVFLFLYTNDEHGHIYEKGGWYKSAALYEMWAEEEKNCPDCAVFKLSGGDNFTGASVSTFFQGAPTAELMGEIGYKISAVGNHEFDFGEISFKNNRALSNVVYLSSNVACPKSEEFFSPYLIYETGDAKISFIGSMTEDLKQISIVPFFKDCSVEKSETAVKRVMEEIKSKVDFHVVLAHESFENAKTWIKNLPIKPLVVFTGHDHKETVEKIDGVLFVQNGGYLPSYARVFVEKRGDSFSVVKADIVPLKRDAAFASENSAKIKRITDDYLEKLDKKMGEKLILSKEDLPLDSFAKLYACAALKAYPDSEVSMSNPGGFRDVVEKGYVKKSDLLSMMPFENLIVLSKINGEDLIYNLNLSGEAYCGAVKRGEKWFIKGKEVQKDQQYRAVIQEYIYKGGDNYRFNGRDAVNDITSTNWRDPLEKFLMKSAEEGKTLEDAYQEILKQFERN